MTIASQPGENPLRLTWDPPDELTFLEDDLIQTHLSLDEVNGLGSMVELYEQAAINWAENYMRRSIMAREHRWVLADFPRGYHRASVHSLRAIQLPRGKTVRVNSIQYSRGGSTITLTGPSTSPTAGSSYQEDLHGDMGGVILPLRNRDWPSVDYDVVNPVVINFRAGWEEPDDVPAAIKHAVLVAMSEMLEHRGLQDLASLQTVAAQGKTLEFRESLIGDYRIIRVY